MRTFRLLRIFKLVKNWKDIQNLLKIIITTLKDISTFSILLFIFAFTYTLIGMEFFAHKAKFDENNKLDLSENGRYIDFNFNNFLQGFLTVFIVLTGDQWSEIYYRHYRAVGGVVSSFYFLSLMLVG